MGNKDTDPFFASEGNNNKVIVVKKFSPFYTFNLNQTKPKHDRRRAPIGWLSCGFLSMSHNHLSSSSWPPAFQPSYRAFW